eukprot:COSAG01_NODE_2069_length_8498_cov_5.965841_2_plen_136_part_00
MGGGAAWVLSATLQHSIQSLSWQWREPPAGVWQEPLALRRSTLQSAGYASEDARVRTEQLGHPVLLNFLQPAPHGSAEHVGVPLPATGPAPAQARSELLAAGAVADGDRWQMDDSNTAEMTMPPVRAPFTALPTA